MKEENEIIKEEPKLTIEKTIVDEYFEFKREEFFNAGEFLGVFDENGYYIISQEMKEELVSLKKYLKDRSENSIKAILPLGILDIKVRVDFIKNEGSTMTAKMYLLERIGDDVVETYIAKYEDEESLDFKESALIAFNIEENEDALEVQESPVLTERIQKRVVNSADRDFMIEMYSELYVLRLIEILKKKGDIGKEVLEEYYKEIKEKGLTALGTKKLYTKLRDTLDRKIEKKGGLTAVIGNGKEIESVIKEFLNPIKEFDKIEKSIYGTSGAPLLGAEKKKNDSKSSSDGKKSTGSSKPFVWEGPKAKKADKKKEEKKKDDKKKKIIGILSPDKKKDIAKKIEISKPTPSRIPYERKTIASKSFSVADKPAVVSGAPPKDPFDFLSFNIKEKEPPVEMPGITIEISTETSVKMPTDASVKIPTETTGPPVLGL